MVNVQKLLLVTMLLVSQVAFSQSIFHQKEAKRILFLGNSITYQGQFIEYIEAYYTIKYPNEKLEFINVGLPSETVSGLSEEGHADGRFPRPDLHERLDRVLDKIRPDIILACYGMNDGIYLPFNKQRFKSFKKGINWLHKEANKKGIEIIYISPGDYDQRKGEEYSKVLDIYSDWLISKKERKNWRVIDIHWPMKKALAERRKAEPEFVFAEDGVHPNQHGHFVMALSILLGLGENSIKDAKDIDDILKSHENGVEILKLVQTKQRLSKDAWLTETGHTRPEMNQGVSMEELEASTEKIDKEIQKLLKE